MRFQKTPESIAIAFAVVGLMLMIGGALFVVALGQGYRKSGFPEPRPTPTPVSGAPTSTPRPTLTPTPSNLAPAPNGLKVTAVTETRISLSWDSVPDAHGYVIERDSKAQGTFVADCFRSPVERYTTDTGFVDSTNLWPGRTYYYRVCARGDGTRYADWFGPPSIVLRVPFRRGDATTP